MNDARPFRVLQVFAPGAFGGAESVVMTLSRGLAARGHALHAAATLGPAEPEPGLLARMRSAGVDVHVLRIPPRRYDRERRGLIDVARATNADVMHTHGYRSDLVGLSAARLLGLPIVSTVHGFTGGRWKNRWYERLQRSAWRRFDGVVAVSDPLARELRRVSGDALALHTVRNAWVPPGAPLPRAAARARLGLGLDEIVVGWVGRLTREKGCDLFLDAVARLEDLEVTFSIVGEGPERPILRPRFAARERDGRLRWHGAIADAWA
ncbi:MAG: glycosyltransferase family 4 protein, partial [Gemmatimonadota bacterium]